MIGGIKKDVPVMTHLFLEIQILLCLLFFWFCSILIWMQIPVCIYHAITACPSKECREELVYANTLFVWIQKRSTVFIYRNAS